MLKEAEGKQVLVSSSEKRLNSVLNELEPSEVQETELNIQSLESEAMDLISALKNCLDKSGDAVLERKLLESNIDNIREKIRTLSGRQPNTVVDEPLLVVTIEKRLADNKVILNNNKLFYFKAK